MTTPQSSERGIGELKLWAKRIGGLNLSDHYADELIKRVDQELQKARADWLRSEIEKLEGMMGNIPPYPHEGAHGQAITLGAQRGYQDVLTSIITRYKEELLELENGK